MARRIRYAKNQNPGELVSVRIFPGPMDQFFRVHLNKETLTFEIVDINSSNQVVADGAGVSMGNLKIKAKRALESFGVVFEDESRNKVKNSIEV